MKGSRPDDDLNSIFGNGNWTTAPPPPCKIKVGTKIVTVKSSAKRKEHTREYPETIPNPNCNCKWKKNCYPAKCPELNITENVFSWIRDKLKKNQKQEHQMN